MQLLINKFFLSTSRLIEFHACLLQQWETSKTLFFT